MTTGSNRRREQGLSLVELLVSVTILAVAATIALVLYDGARQSFKLGENVAEQQQAVRIAFDLISSDIRMAGFNTNPDGSKTRPDEQIEAVYDTAIVVRADFDARDPIDSRDPEDALAGPGGAFLSVSTGNDEIRAYVLAKPGGASTDTLTFFADVGEPVRNGSVETVDLTNISLVHDDPPYTLYRVTLDENAAPARTVLIENVRSMAFRYYDGAGNAIAAVGGSDGPADVSARAAIRRVGVEIEALTRDPDLKWVDAEDSNPLTRAFRKFKLKGDITPRNLGQPAAVDAGKSAALRRTLWRPEHQLARQPSGRRNRLLPHQLRYRSGQPGGPPHLGHHRLLPGGAAARYRILRRHPGARRRREPERIFLGLQQNDRKHQHAGDTSRPGRLHRSGRHHRSELDCGVGEHRQHPG
jgi:prepilin-type N-terminal cleavage/methylation domain-containing protein